MWISIRLYIVVHNRLEMTFGKPNVAHWLRLQNVYDLWQTQQRLGVCYL